MELTPIRYFVKLADVLNFTEAAKALFITQSTLSISIKQLEEEIGAKLFDRIGKKVYLTEEGCLFLTYAQTALTNIHDGVQEINAVNRIFKGKLRIGVTYSTAEILNSRIIQYTEKYPDVRLTIIMSTTVAEAIDGILSNKLDIAITYKPEKLLPTVAIRPLTEAPLNIIVHKNHELATRQQLSLKEICGYPFVTFLKGMHTRNMIEKLFAANDMHIVPQVEVNDTNLILEMVETGHWISILSPLSIRRRENCTAIPIADKNEILSVCIMWLKERSKQVLCQTLINEIVEPTTELTIQ